MHVVVLLKQVPATDNVRLDPETGTMVRGTQDNILNPLDQNALAEARRIKSLDGTTTVTVLSMGPETAVEALREGVAVCADRAVLLSSRAFAGSDTIATSKVLAAAIKKLMPVDLVLAGERATDGETGQTGPMVAARLDFPVVTFVRRVDVQEGALSVERIVEDGFEELEVDLPALITVVKDINEPQEPSLKNRLQAKKVQVPVWGPEELGLSTEDLGLKGSPTRVVKVFSPKLARNAVMFDREEMEMGIRQIIDKFTLLNVI